MPAAGTKLLIRPALPKNSSRCEAVAQDVRGIRDSIPFD